MNAYYNNPLDYYFMNQSIYNNSLANSSIYNPNINLDNDFYFTQSQLLHYNNMIQCNNLSLKQEYPQQYEIIHSHNCYSNSCSTSINGSVNTTNTNDFNIIQDDNFSIATVSDFCNIQSSPSFHQMSLTPLSTPPTNQLSDFSYCVDHQFYDVHQLDSLENSKKRKNMVDSSSEKNYICPTCNHRSKRKHNLIEHMLTHNPNRPKSFLCGFCNRAFARKYDMKRHEKIHIRKSLNN